MSVPVTATATKTEQMRSIENTFIYYFCISMVTTFTILGFAIRLIKKSMIFPEMSTATCTSIDIEGIGDGDMAGQ